MRFVRPSRFGHFIKRHTIKTGGEGAKVMIETKKLRKVFGPIEAVKGVSFRVEKGEVLGFLGPNGAGKSTVMRMLTCFLQPTAGTASIGGNDILEHSLDARRLIGYLPESNPVYNDMSVIAFLNFIGEMRGYKGQELKKRVDKVLESCWLTNVRHQMVETLSKGYKRRVGLAQALIHNPPVLILDEPTDGLDPNQKHEVRTLINAMAPDKAIIISTHLLEEVEAVCTRAIIIAEGRIVADGTPSDLLCQSRYHGAVHLTVQQANIDDSLLRGIEGVRDVERIGSDNSSLRFMLFPKNDTPITQPILNLVSKQGWKLEELHVENGRLDEVFRKITTEGGKRS
jgi:ABC-2 type transport system ATP-binding protein